MKRRSLFLLFACFLMENLISGQPFTVKKENNVFKFECKGGDWKNNDESSWGASLDLSYTDESSGTYKCVVGNKPNQSLTVKFRTCDSCIELDTPALTAIIVGNLLATFLIAFAVYSLTGQPKGKTFSGNKASDKVNLISNGDRDTYQQLTPGQHSEYSGLVRKK